MCHDSLPATSQEARNWDGTCLCRAAHPHPCGANVADQKVLGPPFRITESAREWRAGRREVDLPSAVAVGRCRRPASTSFLIRRGRWTCGAGGGLRFCCNIPATTPDSDVLAMPPSAPPSRLYIVVLPYNSSSERWLSAKCLFVIRLCHGSAQRGKTCQALLEGRPLRRHVGVPFPPCLPSESKVRPEVLLQRARLGNLSAGSLKAVGKGLSRFAAAGHCFSFAGIGERPTSGRVPSFPTAMLRAPMADKMSNERYSRYRSHPRRHFCEHQLKQPCWNPSVGRVECRDRQTFPQTALLPHCVLPDGSLHISIPDDGRWALLSQTWVLHSDH